MLFFSLEFYNCVCYNKFMDNLKQENLTLDMLLPDTDVLLYLNNATDLYSKKHNHKFYEFMFISDGELLQKFDGQEYVCKKNQVFILRPETSHLVFPSKNESVLLYNFEVNANFFKQLLICLEIKEEDIFFDNPAVFTLSQQDANAIVRMLLKLTTVKTAQKQNQTNLKTVITKFLFHVLDRRSQHNSFTSTLIPIVLKALNNPDNFDKTVENICNDLNYTPEHITRLFKKAKLNSPNKIFLKNKLAHAAFLLQYSKIRIIEVSNICGIFSLSYFNKRFKAEYGFPPSEFRKHTSIRNK